MNFEVNTTKPETESVDALVVGIFEEATTLPADVRALDVSLGGLITDILAEGSFRPKSGSQLVIPAGRKSGPKWIVLLGMGKAAEFKFDHVRQVAARAATVAREHVFRSVALLLPDAHRLEDNALHVGQAVGEGATLGLYTYENYKTENEDHRDEPDRMVVFTGSYDETELRQGLAEGVSIGSAVAFARDLVQTPAMDLTPTILAERSQKMADDVGIRCQILVESEIADLKMGAFLGVAQGALRVQPPRFIVLEYLPFRGEKPLVFVGKGITFDSGGISIKPADGMEKMKYDMAGGAAVIGAMRAIATLKLPVNAIGLVPATENMPGGHAIHPGDILTSMSGKTIEVVNTDAEGRLILSDALTYAERYDPEAVIDLATLTGACVIALGHQAIAILGNDQRLVDRVRMAGERAWERCWQLPLWEEYNDQIKSDLADMKNSGGRPGGTITAAAMLAKFASSFPWAHLDIAGTAWEEKGRPYVPKGATGVGVRLLLEVAKEYANLRPAKRTEIPTTA